MADITRRTQKGKKENTKPLPRTTNPLVKLRLARTPKRSSPIASVGKKRPQKSRRDTCEEALDAPEAIFPKKRRRSPIQTGVVLLTIEPQTTQNATRPKISILIVVNIFQFGSLDSYPMYDPLVGPNRKRCL
jgi:hypothetical protein